MSFLLHQSYINSNKCSVNHKKPILFSENRLQYILKGHGTLKIKDYVFPLFAGQTFFIPQGTTASFWANEKTDWEYMWLNFETNDFFNEMLQKTAFSPRNPVCNQTTKEQIEILQEIISNKWNMHNGSYYRIFSMVALLLATYIETFPSTTHLTNNNTVESLITFIDNNFHHFDLNIHTLMEATGLSHSTIYERIKKETGLSPKAYIQLVRYHHAIHLIKTTDLSIKEIATATGYSDPLYFSSVFHKKMKLSPTAFRRKFQKAMPKE